MTIEEANEAASLIGQLRRVQAAREVMAEDDAGRIEGKATKRFYATAVCSVSAAICAASAAANQLFKATALASLDAIEADLKQRIEKIGGEE